MRFYYNAIIVKINKLNLQEGKTMYPQIPDYRHLAEQIAEYSRLKYEYGSENIQPLLDEAEELLKTTYAKIAALPIDKKLSSEEPDDLDAIRNLRPEGPRKIWKSFNMEKYRERLEGSLLSRMAGCILGSIVESWPVEAMEKWAAHIGDTFPPVDYWSRIKDETGLRYEKSSCMEYTRSVMNGVPVDDDIIYTLLGLLIAEDHGPDFSTDDVGKAWLKY
jgi:hypothetical protein